MFEKYSQVEVFLWRAPCGSTEHEVSLETNKKLEMHSVSITPQPAAIGEVFM